MLARVKEGRTTCESNERGSDEVELAPEDQRHDETHVRQSEGWMVSTVS